MNYGNPIHIDEKEALALRQERLDSPHVELLAERLRALSDPVRLGLALALQDGRELCVCDLSWIAQRPQNLTSHHMKVLKGAGIVTARKQGKMTMYRLTVEGGRLASSVIAADPDNSP